MHERLGYLPIEAPKLLECKYKRHFDCLIVVVLFVHYCFLVDSAIPFLFIESHTSCSKCFLLLFAMNTDTHNFSLYKPPSLLSPIAMSVINSWGGVSRLHATIWANYQETGGPRRLPGKVLHASEFEA